MHDSTHLKSSSLIHRLVAGLRLTSSDFAVLPPHFTPEGIRRIHELGLSTFFDCYEDFPDSMKGCCLYFLASVIYHLDTLREWWPEYNHPVWQSKMFVRYGLEVLMELKNHIVTGKFVDNVSQMTATGIPNVIILHARLDAMEGRFSNLEGQFEALESHTNVRFDELALQLRSLPEDITNKLTENFTIAGQQVGRMDFVNFREEVLSLMRNFQATTERSVRTRTSDESVGVTQNDAVNGDTIHVYIYGGAHHLLPQDYKFPSCAAQHMWTMWHLGVATLKIGPLKKLRKAFRGDVPKERRPLIDKAALVMDTIERIAKKRGLLVEGQNITSANCWTIWGPSFREYLTYLYPEERINSLSFRPDELMYTTLHKIHTASKGNADGLTTFEKNYNAANV